MAAAGTLTLTQNSTAVTGSGTAFTTALAVGGFITATVGGTPYTLGIKSIESDTALTAQVAYDGPTANGVAFDYVPFSTLNLITSALAAQVSYALRSNNLDKDNWQQVFSSSTDITVTLPDMSQFTGPSWKKIVDMLNAIDPEAMEAIAQQVQQDAQQVQTDKQDAATSAANAATSEANAKTSENNAKTSENNAKTSETNSASSASNAATSAQQAADAAAGAIGMALSYINGFNLTVSATTVTVGPGIAVIPSLGRSKPVTLSADTTVNIGTTTLSTWYHIYLYMNGTTPAIEVSTTAPAAYLYPAHQKTGDNTRRYLGSLCTAADNTVQPGIAFGGDFSYVNASGNRIVANNVSTAKVTANAGVRVPVTVQLMQIEAANAASTAACQFYVRSTDTNNLTVIQPGNRQYLRIPLLSYPNFYFQYAASPGSTGLYVDVMGYTFSR